VFLLAYVNSSMSQSADFRGNFLLPWLKKRSSEKYFFNINGVLMCRIINLLQFNLSFEQSVNCAASLTI